MDAIIDNLAERGVQIGIALAAVALVLLGIKALFSYFRGDGMRDVFQGVGVVFVGVLLIGGAGALSGAAVNIAQGL